MGRPLTIALSLTDLAFLAYWGVALAGLAGVVRLPPELMYAGFREPRVAAWNWSFLPLDLAFSVTGLFAVRAARRGEALWRPLALISLILTQVAGLMAVGYWTLMGEFDPSWFLPNLVLVVWPLAFLPRLVCDLAGPGRGEVA